MGNFGSCGLLFLSKERLKRLGGNRNVPVSLFMCLKKIIQQNEQGEPPFSWGSVKLSIGAWYFLVSICTRRQIWCRGVIYWIFYSWMRTSFVLCTWSALKCEHETWHSHSPSFLCQLKSFSARNCWATHEKPKSPLTWLLKLSHDHSSSSATFFLIP